MADAPAKKKGGKKVLGQSYLAWGLELGGAVVAYILWKRYSAGQAAAALDAQTAGGGNGAGNVGGTTTSTSGQQSFTSLASWEQAAMSLMSSSALKPADALNALTDWLGGSCVDQTAYTALGNAVSTLGIPPGFGYGVPKLSVCPSHAKKPKTAHKHHTHTHTGSTGSTTHTGSTGSTLTNLTSQVSSTALQDATTGTAASAGSMSASLANQVLAAAKAAGLISSSVTSNQAYYDQPKSTQEAISAAAQEALAEYYANPTAANAKRAGII